MRAPDRMPDRMNEKTLSIAVPGGAITAIRTGPDSQPRAVFAYAPGAGSNVNDPFGGFAGQRLADKGMSAVRFQFPYMEAGKKGPDRGNVLEDTWKAVIEAVRVPGLPLIVGGRSMGGRIASHVAAQGIAVGALALFAYPLHQPGRPERMRDSHLPSIPVPTLFCSGTRDAFASLDELRAAASKVRSSTVHLLEGADHGFAVLKSSARTREEIWAEAVEALLAFVSATAVVR